MTAVLDQDFVNRAIGSPELFAWYLWDAEADDDTLFQPGSSCECPLAYYFKALLGDDFTVHVVLEDSDDAEPCVEITAPEDAAGEERTFPLPWWCKTFIRKIDHFQPSQEYVSPYEALRVLHTRFPAIEVPHGA